MPIHGGTSLYSVLHRGKGPMRRMDSSLRGHRHGRCEDLPRGSGPYKTMFASFGPYLRCRGLRSMPPRFWNKGVPKNKANAQGPGRIKSGRGHRSDVARTKGAGFVPPTREGVCFSVGHGGDVFLLERGFGFGFYGRRFASAGWGHGVSLELGPIADHGMDQGEKPSSQSGIGDGFAALLDEPLFFLFPEGVVPGQAGGGFAQGPSQGGRAGLGDVPGAGDAGGTGVVGGKSRPELQRIAMGEPLEVADFGGDDGPPDFIDARDGFEEGDERGQGGGAIEFDDAEAEFFALPFDELDLIQQVGVGDRVPLFEVTALSQKPPLGGGPGELEGSREVMGVKDGSEPVLATGQVLGEPSPVATEFAKMGDRFRCDPSQGAFVAGQPRGDVGGVVAVVFATRAAKSGQLRGVGDVHAGDFGLVTFDEPLDEGTGFDRQVGRLRELGQEGVHFLGVLGAGGEARKGLPVGTHRGKSHGTLVKIDTDKRLEGR